MHPELAAAVLHAAAALRSSADAVEPPPVDAVRAAMSIAQRLAIHGRGEAEHYQRLAGVLHRAEVAARVWACDPERACAESVPAVLAAMGGLETLAAAIKVAELCEVGG